MRNRLRREDERESRTDGDESAVVDDLRPSSVAEDGEGGFAKEYIRESGDERRDEEGVEDACFGVEGVDDGAGRIGESRLRREEKAGNVGGSYIEKAILRSENSDGYPRRERSEDEEKCVAEKRVAERAFPEVCLEEDVDEEENE